MPVTYITVPPQSTPSIHSLHSLFIILSTSLPSYLFICSSTSTSVHIYPLSHLLISLLSTCSLTYQVTNPPIFPSIYKLTHLAVHLSTHPLHNVIIYFLSGYIYSLLTHLFNNCLPTHPLVPYSPTYQPSDPSPHPLPTSLITAHIRYTATSL